jgi:hypothetical protein
MYPATTHFPIWGLHALQPVFWQVDRIHLLQLRHLDTQLEHRDETESQVHGRTVWAGRAGEGDIALSWDWTYVRGNGTTMDDPYRLLTNLRFVDNWEVLTAFHAAVHLTPLIHSLPWQAEVTAAMAEEWPELAQAA